MKIIVDTLHEDKNIEIEEYLEPQGAYYSIRQGDKQIDFDSEYQMKEVVQSLKFLLDRD